MIIGAGIDLVRVDRIKKAVERWNTRFLSRIYTPQEISYCRKKRKDYLHLAARFAAKEAVRKALEERMNWREIEIVNNHWGKPEVNLRGRAREKKQRQGAKKILLSITHDHDYALAQAVVITNDETTESAEKGKKKYQSVRVSKYQSKNKNC